MPRGRDESEETQSQDMGVLVGAIPKNAREEIRVRLTTFNGYELCDVRMFYKPQDSEQKLPSGKGFAIRRGLIPELINVLQKAQGLSEQA